MLGCDLCDRWFHPACLQAHMPERLPGRDETFICPMCFDAQAEIADDYISDQFLADTFGGAAASASADYDADYSAGYAADYAADYAGIEGFAGMPDLSSIDAAL